MEYNQILLMICTFVTGVGGQQILQSILNKRKYQQETERISVDNQKTTAEVAMVFNDKLLQRIDELENRVKELEKENLQISKLLLQKERELTELQLLINRKFDN